MPRHFRDGRGRLHYTDYDAAPSGVLPGTEQGSTVLTSAGALYTLTTLPSTWEVTDPAGDVLSKSGAFVDERLMRADGTAGAVQSSPIAVTDAGAVSGVTTLGMSGALSGVTTLGMSGVLTVGTTTKITPEAAGTAASLALAEASGNGTNKITIQTDASLAADYTQTLAPVTGEIPVITAGLQTAARGVAMPIFQASLRVQHSDLTDNDTAQTNNFAAALPAGAIVLGAYVNLATEFSGGGVGTCIFDVGILGVSETALLTNGNVFTGSGTGIKYGTDGTAFGTIANIARRHLAAASTPTVTITVDTTVDALTAGDLTVYIIYTVAP